MNSMSQEQELERVYDEDGENFQQNCCCDPRRRCYRFIGLIFMCFLGFGSYFCYDNPAALQENFKHDLNITITQFTAFYSVYSWPNVVLCFVGGFLIDRIFGIRLGTNIYMFITLLGQMCFAFGAFVNQYWLMILGRFIFGIGGESLAVAQNNYAVLWFKGKELNMVFGIQLSFARIGSTVNFFVMDPIYEWVSNFYTLYQCLGIVLFLAGATCLLSMICSLALGILDKRTERILSRNINRETEVIRLRDVKDFSLPFWLVSIICVAYYVTIFPFIALGENFFCERFHWDKQSANTVNGIVYFVSAIVSPFTGIIIDKTGRNIMWIALSIIVTGCAHGILIFTLVNPYVGMVTMGLAYSLCASGLWPLVSLIIPEYQLGTAYGLCQAIQNLGLAVISLLTGYIVQKAGYFWLEIFFFFCLSIALISTIIMWKDDKFKKGTLNMTPFEREHHLTSMVQQETEKLLDNDTSTSGEMLPSTHYD